MVEDLLALLQMDPLLGLGMSASRRTASLVGFGTKNGLFFAKKSSQFIATRWGFLLLTFYMVLKSNPFNIEFASRKRDLVEGHHRGGSD